MPAFSTVPATYSSPAAVQAVERALAGLPLHLDHAIALIEQCDFDHLLAAAGELRDRGKGRVVTYSPKVFLPVTNLCRDRCTYCTFRKDPGQPGAWTMTPAEITEWSRRGRAMGCSEALMCLGDKPELAFRGFRRTLAELGATSTADYVRQACRWALEQNLLPHTNAGVLTREEMAMLRPVNVSMGLMLENVSPRLRGRGGVHQWAPDKAPALRLKMIEEAGQLRIPFTTGILLGIGENAAERAESLIAIRDLHARYGHIQEVIVQNFRAKPDIPMAGHPEPEAHEMARAIATARLVLGPAMNVQAPPNLSPNDIELFLRAGINDWGGISPLTRDYVNPEAPWPHLEALGARCAEAGFTLRARLPVYREFINSRWIDPELLPLVGAFMASGESL
ncbi:MAG TPA: 7,8-didemethyl-8-hydroxy-5-deazariboflavin synthase CofG [Candidatus Binataceae bacterium]|nr:7,8-didemethyl-8-hydroxy-5-deazariboflavin synthase CofG [Candidatus Binataceae bacterium]